jgi:hypothetical protein
LLNNIIQPESGDRMNKKTLTIFIVSKFQRTNNCDKKDRKHQNRKVDLGRYALQAGGGVVAYLGTNCIY